MCVSMRRADAPRGRCTSERLAISGDLKEIALQCKITARYRIG
jgi:hypothetical protein